MDYAESPDSLSIEKQKECYELYKKYGIWSDDEKTFRKNYKLWALKNHPDKNNNPDSTKIFQELSNCYSNIENFNNFIYNVNTPIYTPTYTYTPTYMYTPSYTPTPKSKYHNPRKNKNKSPKKTRKSKSKRTRKSKSKRTRKSKSKRTRKSKSKRTRKNKK